MIEEVPAPVCQDNAVLVANHFSLISTGTEGSTIQSEAGNVLDKIRAQPELFKKGIQSLKEKGISATLEEVKKEQNKLILMGYSCAGEVLQAGAGVSGFVPGDKVACAGAGFANHAEVISVPEKLCVKLPAGIDLEQAAFTTIGSIALQGVRRTRVSLGDNIVVLGLGLLGLITTQLVKAAGGRVLAIDLDSDRCALAKELGAERVQALSGEAEILRVAKEFSNGAGADAVIICAATPSNQPVELAIELARKKGRIVVVGSVGMDIPRSPFYEKELDFYISCSYGPGRYDTDYELKGHDYPLPYVRWTEKRNMREFSRLVAEGRVRLKPLINLVVPIEKANDAYSGLLQPGEKKPLAALLSYRPQTIVQVQAGRGKANYLEITPRVYTKGVIQVGLIGCGNFTQAVHLPALSRLPQYRITAVCGRNGVKLKEISQKYGAAFCATDYREILEDEAINLVVITTRHNLHASMVIESAKAGKDVFVEKPLAMTHDELDEVVDVLKETGRNCWVGFNRRYAPLALKAKELLGDKPGPVLINYRINAGFLPPGHWTQDPEEGGGRIVGEVCHFVDWINYLLHDEPTRIQAMAIAPDGGTVVARDNVTAVLGYRRGSMGTITYTSLGDPKLPKERIEIYAGKRVMVIEDFCRMRFYGFSCPDISLKTPDKGYVNQWRMIADNLPGKGRSNFDSQQAVDSSRATLRLMDCLK